MARPAILITGANGQLGNELQALALSFPHFRFFFLSRKDMDIENEEFVNHYFLSNRPAYCINCAAYTAVDKAETDQESAYRVNRDGPAVLARICSMYDTKFMHISTDYVFRGDSSAPYREEDAPNPGSIYGQSKLAGEAAALKNNPASVIIRTAWVYSSYGANFVKTMIRLMKERTTVSVVNDQTGSPTYAADLAAICMTIISNDKWIPGIYHYTNEGKITWYDFAVVIKQMTGSSCYVNAIPSSAFPAVAKRPFFSLLDTQKIKKIFAVSIPDWQESLRRCLKKMDALAEE